MKGTFSYDPKEKRTLQKENSVQNVKKTTSCDNARVSKHIKLVYINHVIFEKEQFIIMSEIIYYFQKNYDEYFQKSVDHCTHLWPGGEVSLAEGGASGGWGR